MFVCVCHVCVCLDAAVLVRARSIGQGKIKYILSMNLITQWAGQTVHIHLVMSVQESSQLAPKCLREGYTAQEVKQAVIQWQCLRSHYLF
jgi:hypothetical protein